MDDRGRPTECERLGYEVGDLFITHEPREADPMLTSGSLVRLVKDDGTAGPYFHVVMGFCADTGEDRTGERLSLYVHGEVTKLESNVGPNQCADTDTRENNHERE